MPTNTRFSNKDSEAVRLKAEEKNKNHLVTCRYVNCVKFFKCSVCIIRPLVIVKEWTSSWPSLFFCSIQKMPSGFWLPSLNISWTITTMQVWSVLKSISSCWKIWLNTKHRTFINISKWTKWRSPRWPWIGSWLSLSIVSHSRLFYVSGIAFSWKDRKFSFVSPWPFWLSIERVFSLVRIPSRWWNTSKIRRNISSTSKVFSKWVNRERVLGLEHQRLSRLRLTIWNRSVIAKTSPLNKPIGRKSWSTKWANGTCPEKASLNETTWWANIDGTRRPFRWLGFSFKRSINHPQRWIALLYCLEVRKWRRVGSIVNTSSF